MECHISFNEPERETMSVVRGRVKERGVVVVPREILCMRVWLS